MKNLETIAKEIRGLEQKSVILYKGYLFPKLEEFLAAHDLHDKVNILQLEEQGKWSMTMNQDWLRGASQGKAKVYVYANGVNDISGVLQEELLALYSQGIVYDPIMGDGWNPETVFCLGKVKSVDGNLVVELVSNGDGFGPYKFTTYDEAHNFAPLCGKGMYQVQKFLKI